MKNLKVSKHTSDIWINFGNKMKSCCKIALK